jgi:hypothetical protein
MRSRQEKLISGARDEVSAALAYFGRLPLHLSYQQQQGAHNFGVSRLPEQPWRCGSEV